MEEVRCRICDGLMCEMNTSENGLVRPFFCCPKRVELESDGSKYFIRCPFCSARNIVEQRTSLSGTRIVEIVRGEMD
jgi:DNA-directed RNA polymerase subunit RPC12/RpoP